MNQKKLLNAIISKPVWAAMRLILWAHALLAMQVDCALPAQTSTTRNPGWSVLNVQTIISYSWPFS
jgi:hypothetical protein